MTLPMVVLFPAKFALSYTFGSILILSSFSFIRGPKTHFMSLLVRERLPFTACYILSIAATLYAALVVSLLFLTPSPRSTCTH